MITISVVWNCGYTANIWGTGDLQRLRLYRGKIRFYDGESFVDCDLTDSVMFDIKVDCPFNIRKKANFNRGEVFAIREIGEDEYTLYIPSSQVGLRKSGTTSYKDDNKTTKYFFDKYTFKGYNLRFWNDECNHGNFEFEGNSVSNITFKVFSDAIMTLKGKAIRAFVKDVQDTCGVSLDEWKITKIWDSYDFVKKGKVKKKVKKS